LYRSLPLDPWRFLKAVKLIVVKDDLVVITVSAVERLPICRVRPWIRAHLIDLNLER